jgi:hypothetical protein
MDLSKLKTSLIAKGRIGVYLPDHPGANNRGYVLRSRIVIENKIGRILSRNEHVHHKNRNKLDDSEENLELTNSSIHAKEHLKDENFLIRKRVLDYEQLKKLRLFGYGYKKISQIMGYSWSSVQSAIRRLERG